ncbi:MAG TPA: hypothetical protein VHE61_23975 [Opitutaceae bacterium]|nr:hypothetical protein [Opitutaceae bacterium]
MVSHDYTKEVGLESAEKRVSKPVAAVLLVIIAIGIALGIHLLAAPSHHIAVTTPAAQH